MEQYHHFLAQRILIVTLNKTSNMVAVRWLILEQYLQVFLKQKVFLLPNQRFAQMLKERVGLYFSNYLD
jgi:hypothetical protein